MTLQQPLLEVDDLRVEFHQAKGVTRAVDGLSLTIRPGRTLGLIGESGCGKSATALSAMGLLPSSARTAGAIRFRGTDLLRLAEPQMRKIRGAQIAMVFQDAMTALNPVMTIGAQVAEVMRIHGESRAEAKERAVELLRLLEIPEPARRVQEYPHQLSGGMRQRVVTAMALACNPDVLIADEPTSALDVVTQAQLIDHIRKLQQRFGMGILLITHDFGVLARGCDRVVVMYAGRKVEEADVDELFERPLHPYTHALLDATPSINALSKRLLNLPGQLAAPSGSSQGSAFAPRCPHANARCHTETPLLVEHASVAGSLDPRQVACFAVEEGRLRAAYGAFA